MMSMVNKIFYKLTNPKPQHLKRVVDSYLDNYEIEDAKRAKIPLLAHLFHGVPGMMMAFSSLFVSLYFFGTESGNIKIASLLFSILALFGVASFGSIKASRIRVATALEVIHHSKITMKTDDSEVTDSGHVIIKMIADSKGKDEARDRLTAWVSELFDLERIERSR